MLNVLVTRVTVGVNLDTSVQGRENTGQLGSPGLAHLLGDVHDGIHGQLGVLLHESGASQPNKDNVRKKT